MKRVMLTVDLPPEMIQTYLENRDKDLQAIDEALAAEDWQQLRQIGHRLKGNGPAFGFDRLGELGASLMDASEAADPARVQTVRDGVQDVVVKARGSD